MRKYFLFLVISIISGSLSAQNFSSAKTQQATQLLQDHGAIVIKFNVATKAQINDDLTNIMSIDNVRRLPNNQGYEVRAYLKQNELQEFLTRAIPFEIVENVQPKAITMATTVAQMASWDRYPTYSVYEQMMANFATTYPNLCDLDTILASTPNGHRILALKISDNVNINENEPQVLFSSSIHGNEETGYVLMLRLINYLLSNYSILPQVANLVNGSEIWICPSANPDGTYLSTDNTISTSALARYNSNSQDLNRDYPRPDFLENIDSTTWEPETKAFIKFAKKHHFNMGVNFHDGTELVNFPWDTWTTTENISADDAWWRRVSRMYADSVQLNAGTLGSSYFTAEDDGITEGADWYYAYGSRQDYMNFFQYCREVTIELSTSQPAGAENLPAFWNAHYRSFLNYLKESLYGVRGVITDSCSGQPIKAKVWVNSYDQTNDSSQVYSALPVGNYHKYMIAGTYSITYSAPGYTSKTINNVVLANGAATYVNVSLAPAASPDAQFSGTVTDDCAGTVQFTNSSTASTNFVWFFGDGATSTDVNPTHTYTANGTYTVKLRALNCKGKDSLVMTNYITINRAEAPTTTGGSSCGAGTVSLSASGAGTLNWYDAASGGNLVNTGNSFSPSLSNTTTYYVENSEIGTPTTAGKTFIQSGGAGTSSGEHYLIFDAYTPFTLISVVMYNTSASAVSRTIALKNSSGVVINGQTTTVNIPAGQSTVTLNFNVPVGTSMRLSCTNGTSLYRHNTGVAYNYTTSGILSITGSDAGANYYYYFYEWLVQTDGCISSRVPVTATILTQPLAGFTSSAVSLTANFTNTSTGATSYFWNFGDASTSTVQNPSHTYAASGTYNVMMIATNGACSDTAYQDVTILPTGGIDDNVFAQVSIYPNPARNEITIMSGSAFDGNVQIDIFSVTGELVLTKLLNTMDNKTSIDISSLSNGVYSLRMINAEHKKYFRIIKSE